MNTVIKEKILKMVKEKILKKIKFLDCISYIFCTYYAIQMSKQYNNYSKKTIGTWLGVIPLLLTILFIGFGKVNFETIIDAKTIFHNDISHIPKILSSIVFYKIDDSIRNSIITLFSILTGFLLNAMVLLISFGDKIFSGEKYCELSEDLSDISDVLTISFLYLISWGIIILLLLVFKVFDFLSLWLVFHFFSCFLNMLRHFNAFIVGIYDKVKSNG
jgi:hypothetical protein